MSNRNTVQSRLEMFFKRLRLPEVTPKRRNRMPAPRFAAHSQAPAQFFEAMEPRLYCSATYHGGPLLTNVAVTAIYVGNWDNDRQLESTLNSFLATVVNSTYMDQLSEYSETGKVIGRGSFEQGANDLAQSGNYTDQIIQNVIGNNIANKDVPAPTKNTLYVIYMAPGDDVQESNGKIAGPGGSDGGYHSYADISGIAGRVYYAVVPGQSDAATAETYTSHELAEAVTDPVPLGGWSDDSIPSENIYGAEIGDRSDEYFDTRGIPRGTTFDGVFTVEPMWSNQHGGPYLLTSPNKSFSVDPSGNIDEVDSNNIGWHRDSNGLWTSLAATQGAKGYISLNWSAVPGAVDYKLVRVGSDNSNATLGWLGNTTSFWDSAAVDASSGQSQLIPGVNYTYTLVAAFGTKNVNGGTDYSNQKPAISGAIGYFNDLSATQGTLSGAVQLSWTPVPNAVNYKLTRVDPDNSSATLGWLGNTNSFWDSPAVDKSSGQPLFTAGVHYTYKLIAAFGTKDANGGTDYSNQQEAGTDTGYSTVLSATPGTYTGAIELTWSLIAHAIDYKLVRVGSDHSNATLGWLGNTSSFWDSPAVDASSHQSPLLPGVNYTYALVAAFGTKNVNGGTDYSNQQSEGIAIGYSNVLSATAGTLRGAVQLSWTPVPNAVDYKLTRVGSDNSNATLGWLGNVKSFWDSPYVDASSGQALLAADVHYTYKLIAAFGSKNVNGGTDYSNQQPAGIAIGYTTAVIDNTSPQASVIGAWTASSFAPGFVSSNYLTDGNTNKGLDSVTYSPALAPRAYHVEVNSVGGSNRATNVPIDVYLAGGTVRTFIINEQTTGYIDLGNLNLDANSKVVIRNTGTNGYVIADAVEFVPSTTVVIDNISANASVSGTWTTSTYTPGYVGADYLTDGNTGKGTKTVTYTPNLTAGTYDIKLNSVGGSNRATNVPVDIYLAGGTKVTVVVNEQANGLLSLGTFALDANSKVVIRTDGTNGYVVADAMEFVAA